MLKKMTVGQLEEALFKAFPRDDAEPWDQPGLAVGDRDEKVKGVAVNLDMTTEAVIAAADAGCNVLVTHHPPFIKNGPTEFAPAASSVTSGPGRMVFEAARRGVSVIAMHTNADRSVATRMRYENLLCWECTGNFEHLGNPSIDPQGPGFGALFALKDATLADVATECASVFGGSPRVWGDPDAPIKTIALLNGSWGDSEVYDTCIAKGIDCIVVGETRYHFCADAQPHLAIVDLGHDRSELPIEDVLADALAAAGIKSDDIYMLDCSSANWWTPETER